jgi:transcription antitermination factor NusG
LTDNTEAPWFIVLTEPQQDLTTVWRLHELGEEMFVPVIRKRVKTGRVAKNGHKVTRVIAKPMFPGYGFLRSTSARRIDEIKDVRGVRDVLRGVNAKPVLLPHAAVIAVFRKQGEEHQEWLKSAGGRRGGNWKRGDTVRIDSDGGAFSGLVGKIDKVNARGRIEILFGMIRHSIPSDYVVAA